MITYVKSLPFVKCRDLYQLSTPDLLPQQRIINDFVQQQQVNDIFQISYPNIVDPDRIYDMIFLTVNHDQFLEIRELDRVLCQLKRFVGRFFYLSVNKFLLYTTSVINTDACHDLDAKLLVHWQSTMGFDLVLSGCRSDDHGQLGNFIFPVTYIVLQR